MKKLIAISVMLALIVGAVFAETQVSGGVETRLTVATWDNNGTNATTSGGIGTAFINLSGTNDDGTLGGTFRLRNEDIVRSREYAIYGTSAVGATSDDLFGVETSGTGSGASTKATLLSGAWFHKAYVWWKPIPQLKVFLGIDQDGLFDTADLEGWAYHKGSEGFINNHDWDFWRFIFPGNWDGFGLALSVYPIDGLDINVVVPTGGRNWPQATLDNIEQKWRVDEMFFNGLRFQVNYALSGIGKVHLTWMGPNDVAGTGWGGGTYNVTNYTPSVYYEGAKKDKSSYKTKGLFGASFLLTAIDGLQANVGFSTAIVNTDNVANGKSPTNLGLGVAYAHESGFGAKARLAYQMNVNFVDKSTQLFFTVMPYYALGSLTVFCDVGFTFADYDNKAKFGDDTQVPWHVNPYITVPISGGKFQTGIKIDGKGKKKNVDDVITVAIPMLLGFNF